MRTEAGLQLLLLGGRSGSGKTTVAHEVSAQLQALGVAHCHVEGDNLDAAYPKPADDPHGTHLTEVNLTALWRNYQAIGHSRLIYVNTASILEPKLFVRAMTAGDDRLVDVDVVAVELVAADETAAARLAVREVGGGLALHVERSRRMAQLLAQQAPPGTVRVVTDDRGAADVAAAVIDLTGWAGLDR